MRSLLPRRLTAVIALVFLAACSTKTTNNSPAETPTTITGSGATTSSVGTRPGPGPGVITPTPTDASSVLLEASDAATRPPGGGPRLGSSLPEVQVGGLSSSAAYFAEGPEQEFREMTNVDRGIVGAPLVARDQYLDDYARAQAQAMGQAASIYHSNIGVLLCCYWTVGENVGVGGSARQIQYAYEASFGHFRNLTNAAFSRMGIGVYVDPSGRMWTASAFAG